MDPSVEKDADLERLLAQLLRVVNPAAAADAGGSLPTGQSSLTGQENTLQPGEGFPPVSVSEARALIELLAARGIAQGQLATLLGLEKSTMSRLAAGLERKGWIRRGRDQENQRYVRLHLSDEGRVLAGQVWRAWQSRQERILASLSAEERAGLTSGLRGLIRGLAAEGLVSDAAGPDATGPDAAGPDATGPETTGPDDAGPDGAPAGRAGTPTHRRPGS